MKVVIAVALLLLGTMAPRLAGNRDTTTWLLWFIRRLFPALCLGAAVGLVLSALRND
jgi:uncharacterized protein (DUF3820 family)